MPNPRPNPKRLKELFEKASSALFDLHDYMRRHEGEDSGWWRQIYGYRVHGGMLIDARMKYWEREYDKWMDQVRVALQAINMPFDEWQCQFPYEGFEQDFFEGLEPHESGLKANKHYWAEQNKALPDGHPAKIQGSTDTSKE